MLDSIMRLRAMADGRSGQVLALVLAALTMAVALCLFDDDISGTAQGGLPDFCAGGALVSAAPVLLGLALSGRLEDRAPRSLRAVRLGALDPPPKSQSAL